MTTTNRMLSTAFQQTTFNGSMTIGHPLATGVIVTQIANTLSERNSLTVNGSGALADAIAALPGTDNLDVIIRSVNQSAAYPNKRGADVIATIAGLEVVALIYIKDNGEHSIFTARFASEKPLPMRDHNTFPSMEFLRKTGQTALAGILDLVDFEYGSGAVKLGDGPMRHINCFNCVYDAHKRRMHLNDIVIDLDKDILVAAGGASRDDAPTSFLLNGVRLEFALDTNFPDGELCTAVGSVDSLLDQLSDGSTSALSITVDGVERILTADDIVVTRQPKISDVIGLDRATLSEPVRDFLDDFEREIHLSDDLNWQIQYTDKDAGKILHADLGGHYAFDHYGSEGLLGGPNDQPWNFEGMDMQGRFIAFRTIPATETKLAD